MSREKVGSIFYRRGAEGAEHDGKAPLKNLCALCVTAPLR